MSKHIINLHQVHASIMQKKILENIHLNVQPGEKIGIIGPSGSGKSSLIRIINLLLPPSSGQFHLFNKLVNPLQPPKEDLLKIGMVFQKFELFPHLTVMENLTLAPTLVKQYPLEKARDLAEKMLCRVGLKHYGDRFPSSLSGGQAQRVAIARCLVMKPTILLLDEPTSALDPEMVGEVRHVLEEIIEPHMSILLVSHEIPFIEKIASRVLFMQEGQIEVDLAKDAFFAQRENKRLDQFLSQIT